MDIRDRIKNKVLRKLESPAYITAEAQVVDLLKKHKANIQVEIGAMVIDLKNQALVIKPSLSYRNPQDEVIKLPTGGDPLIVLKLEDIGDSAFDLCENLIDVGIEHVLEDLIDNKVFGLETADDYIKE